MKATMSMFHSGTPQLALSRQVTIAALAFLTVVDLFAAQALLPALARKYAVDAATMANAVNACTFGMAIAGLGVAAYGQSIDRRRGVTISLLLLAVPTLLLAVAPNLIAFAVLRVGQGLLMSTAFALTLASLSETTERMTTSAAFAAYITGNVASNLFGRLIAASVADMSGLGTAFAVFAALNVAGSALAARTLHRIPHRRPIDDAQSMAPASLRQVLGDRGLRAAFGIGFCILFAFIGTFSYVNYLLASPPFGLGMMQLGFVYVVFAPSILTTPFAGRLVRRLGTRATLTGGLLVALTGLPLLVGANLSAVLLGLTLVGVGTFLAQAVASAYVGRAAGGHANAANGIYLASYFIGGLAGSAVLGQIYSHAGWPATVAGVGLVLLVAVWLTQRASEAMNATP